MIRPAPFKKVCEKCGYKVIKHPLSDALSIEDMMPITCKKCGGKMKTKKLNIFDVLLRPFSLFK